jgi:hypothetical protein
MSDDLERAKLGAERAQRDHHRALRELHWAVVRGVARHRLPDNVIAALREVDTAADHDRAVAKLRGAVALAGARRHPLPDEVVASLDEVSAADSRRVDADRAVIVEMERAGLLPSAEEQQPIPGPADVALEDRPPEARESSRPTEWDSADGQGGTSAGRRIECNGFVSWVADG